MRDRGPMSARPPAAAPAPADIDPLEAALRGPLAAAGLPDAWRGADTFTVLALGFGSGLGFLAALRAWRADPSRATRLHWAATLERPVSREALHDALVAQRVAPADREPLLSRWPCALAGVHRMPFHDGHVLLSLAVGPARTMVPGWVPRADALLLSYSAADAAASHDAQMPFGAWRGAAACLAPGAAASLAPAPGEAACDALRTARDAGRRVLESAGLAATAADDRDLRAGDGHAGRLFSLPSWSARRVRGHAAASALEHGERPAGARQALVIGAGLAGCAAAFALARRGWDVLRLDADAPRGSDQPVLAQHPSLTPDDAPLSRLTRAATLLAHGAYDVGVLRRHGRIQLADPERAQAVTARLPRDWVEPVDAPRASERAGVALRRGGWWLPMAGSADPRALCDAWTVPGVTARRDAAVATLLRLGSGWTALDTSGRVLAEASLVLLACGTRGPVIVDAPGAAPRSIDDCFGPAGLQRRAGLTTIVTPDATRLPRCTVGGDGHAVPVDATRLLLGPAGGEGDSTAPDDGITRAWARFAAQLADPGPRPQGRAGHRGERMSTRDHLPLVGPLPDTHAQPNATGRGRDDRRLRPSLPGLWIATAFGGRGLLWSVLAAELIAARLEGEPAPLERTLAAALAPDRFLGRSRRATDTAG